MRDLSVPMICALRRAIELPPFPLAWLFGFEDGQIGDAEPPWVRKLCECAGIDGDITRRYMESEVAAENMRNNWATEGEGRDSRRFGGVSLAIESLTGSACLSVEMRAYGGGL